MTKFAIDNLFSQKKYDNGNGFAQTQPFDSGSLKVEVTSLGQTMTKWHFETRTVWWVQIQRRISARYQQHTIDTWQNSSYTALIS